MFFLEIPDWSGEPPSPLQKLVATKNKSNKDFRFFLANRINSPLKIRLFAKKMTVIVF